MVENPVFDISISGSMLSVVGLEVKILNNLNKNIKTIVPLRAVKTFKRKRIVPDRSISNKKFSSVSLNGLAMKAREGIL